MEPNIKLEEKDDQVVMEAQDSVSPPYGALEWFLAALMISLLLVVFIQVVVRYATYQPLAWTEEVARLLFIWACMVGAAIGAKRGNHFAVTLIFDIAPLSLHRSIKFTLLLIEAAFYAVFTWSAYIVTRIANNQHSPSLDYPISLSYGALTISGGLMCLFVL